MSILFHHSIMHLLDRQLDSPLLSQKPLQLDDESEAFLTTHLVKLLEHMQSSTGRFLPDSPFYTSLQSSDYDFLDWSYTLAHRLFDWMKDHSSIPSGDLILVDFTRDGHHYIGFFKINYKEAFTHVVDQSSEGVVNTLLKHRCIFPDSSQKIQECALINLATFDVFVIDALKNPYVKELLGVTSSLTVKEKIKVVEHVMTEAIEGHFENKIEALSFAKSNIAKSISSTSSILLDDVLEETFGEHPQIVEECLTKCKNFGLEEKHIPLPKAETTYKKYASHRLKTSTGIEIKLPTELLNDSKTIEFINNPDGTISILLKNIGELINK